MRSLALSLVVCFSGILCAQTTATPNAPSAERQEEKKSRLESFPTILGPVSGIKSAARLTPKQKFQLFLYNTVNPYPVAVAAASAGVAQATDSQEGYGQGTVGYGKRFGAAYAGNASTQFFGKFVYPAIFQQDPRFFPQGTGSIESRTMYAFSRIFVTRNDSGRQAANYSFWLAGASAAALTMTYYPAGDRSAADAAVRFGTGFATQAGFNVVKEFWPDVKKKLFKKK